MSSPVPNPDRTHGPETPTPTGAPHTQPCPSPSPTRASLDGALVHTNSKNSACLANLHRRYKEQIGEGKHYRG